MANIFLGFTFLCAAFFPIGAQVFQWSLNFFTVDSLRDIPRIYFHLGMAFSTYLFAAVVVAIFFKFSHLKERLPNPFPAQALMLIGVLLSLFFFAALTLASTVEGGGGLLVVSQFAPLVVWPARILLVIGAVKVLLAASPLNNHTYEAN